MSVITSAPFESAAREDIGAKVLRWQRWPLVDQPRWSWIVPVGTLAVAGVVAQSSESWVAGSAAGVVFSVALWDYLVPMKYEIHSTGIRRQALGRIRTIPWHAVRAYRPMASGVMLYQRPDPIAIDALLGIFVPYPPEPDELVCCVREYLGHAVELT